MELVFDTDISREDIDLVRIQLCIYGDIYVVIVYMVIYM